MTTKSLVRSAHILVRSILDCSQIVFNWNIHSLRVFILNGKTAIGKISLTRWFQRFFLTSTIFSRELFCLPYFIAKGLNASKSLRFSCAVTVNKYFFVNTEMQFLLSQKKAANASLDSSFHRIFQLCTWHNKFFKILLVFENVHYKAQ